MNKYYLFENTNENLALLLNDVNAGRVIGGTEDPNVCSLFIPDRNEQITVNTETGTQILCSMKSIKLAAEIAEPAPQGLEIPITDILTTQEFMDLDKIQICDFQDIV
jgi:hypothetical protein